MHRGLQRGAGVQLALRRPLFADKLHIGPLGLEQFLEAGDGALAVFVVGSNRGPAFGRHLGRFLDQHGCLHIGAGAHAEGVAVAFFPNQRVGQWFAGDIDALVFLRKITKGQPHVGQKAPSQHIDIFARGEFDGMAQRFFGLANVVAGNHFDLAAQQAAGGIDFFHGQLPALTVRQGELGNGRVAVDFTNLDGHSRGGLRGQRRRQPQTAQQRRF